MNPLSLAVAAAKTIWSYKEAAIIIATGIAAKYVLDSKTLDNLSSRGIEKKESDHKTETESIEDVAINSLKESSKKEKVKDLAKLVSEAKGSINATSSVKQTKVVLEAFSNALEKKKKEEN